MSDDEQTWTEAPLMTWRGLLRRRITCANCLMVYRQSDRCGIYTYRSLLGHRIRLEPADTQESYLEPAL